ncbi:MAG: hypothetical protein OEM97_10210 [Acidimicrobiia bacterium]|nr:hypothetical protein [Acidimicrobiia bacterium]
MRNQTIQAFGWQCSPRWFGDAGRYDAVEASLRVLARGNVNAHSAVERVDNRRVAYVTGLLIAAGVPAGRARQRAAVFYRALIGEFGWREAGGDPLSDRARNELVTLLLSEPTL